MPREQLEDQLQRLLAERAFLGAEGLPYDETEFSRRQHECGGRIAAATQEAAGLIAEIFAAFHRCQVALDGISGDRWRASREDMQGQLGALMHADFLTSTPPDWLSHYPRYLQAVVYRIEKLTSGGQARDEANMADVAVHWRRYEEAIGRPRTDVAADEALHACRWMIEEYRVSLFAQPLGTCIKVSPQRLEKQWRQAT
jgi:ATP-dependent helicase HrpA